HAPVDEIFALPGPIEPPADHDFAGLGGEHRFVFALLLSLEQLLEPAAAFLCVCGLCALLVQLFLSLVALPCIRCCSRILFHSTLLCVLCALGGEIFLLFRCCAFHHEARRFRKLRIFHGDGYLGHAQWRPLRC